MQFFIILVLVAYVNAAAFYNQGSCPTGRHINETWYPENQCMECYCEAQGYGCYGCGVIADVPGCKIFSDMTLQHPQCCPKIVCPHDS